jgi:hypothetical protein
VLARCFEKIHGAERVDLEIEKGNIACFVVGGLGRTVNDQIKTVHSKKLFDGSAVTNIERRVGETLGRSLQPLQVPLRVARGTEENAAQVVVHADDAVALPVEMFDSF